MPEVTVALGDLTTQQVDAVVNAANRRLRRGNGVSGAIHSAGGSEILADCIARFPSGLAIGDAGWTTAGHMPARWVIHTVGPNYTKGQADRALLTSCYRRSLEVADELGATTVAFPLISSGIYGWPHDDAVRAAVETLRATESQVREARIVVLRPAVHSAVQALLLPGDSRGTAPIPLGKHAVWTARARHD